MDADLEDPPEEISRLLEKWREGYDVVYAVRQNRKEGRFKRLCYWVFYRIMARLVAFEIPLDSAISVSSAGAWRIRSSHAGAQPFCPRVAGVGRLSADRRGLQTGRPLCRAAQIQLQQAVKLATDGLFSFSTVPLRLATYLGITVSAFAFFGVVITLVQKIFAGKTRQNRAGPHRWFPDHRHFRPVPRWRAVDLPRHSGRIHRANL